MWSQIIEIQLYGNRKLYNLNIKNAKKIIQCNYTRSLWEKNLVSISICEMNLLPLISGIFLDNCIMHIFNFKVRMNNMYFCQLNSLSSSIY